MFNSRSASIGETLIALKIEECEKAGMGFQEVVDIGLQRSDGNAVVHEKSVECRYEQNLSLCIG